ncbi:endonuclease/exonuclease/phosphatase family protein [Limnoglobus roseus]|uniref:Endonuclease/exonuclease/phosphatase domain-containing protein n=1 Tax=Limnoglobus roseus TaxID=2598579 RepID=A0A5C1AC03_9BACT|nr:endonuclease/exonuclease/phosphatase family protein [Limnoglobus roseus]QEL16801.1 hypothetical protein PX52LOC_03774 [Limnoglobus roseus]
MRLLSYNIHKGIGGRDRRYDLDRVVRVVEHVNPDVLCLQEVTRHARRTRGDDQPQLLRDAVAAADSAFQLNHHYRRGGYGNLILSRWPILRRHHVSLRCGWRKARGGQLVVVDTPEGLLHLAHWHLGLTEGERRWQVERLLGHALFRESAGLPTMVVGDCNDWRNRLAAGPLASQGFQHITAPPSRFRTFPAFLPALSLDKAFHRGLFIREAAVVRTPLAHRASDHLPLVIDFHLRNPHQD